MTSPDPFAMTMSERLARARADLRLGLPIALIADGRAALVVAAEVISTDRLAAFIAGDKAHLAITHWRAKTLKARVYDGDVARLQVPQTLSRAGLQHIIDPASDLASPLKGPFQTLRDGTADIARAGLALAKSARVLPAILVRDIETVPPDLTTIALGDLTDDATDLHRVVSARLPIQVSRHTQLHIFRPEDGGDEHYAVEIGQPDRSAAPLVRLHSACFTGDILGSLKCDCGPQLHAALGQMAEARGGVLLYLNQEGRGIGLVNKMRAYALQDQGFDTVEANHRLGFEDDERDFRIGATLLKRMGISRVRLLTNNPRKVAMLESCDIAVVERIPLWVGQNPLNEGYLQTKSEKSGHLK